MKCIKIAPGRDVLIQCVVLFWSDSNRFRNTAFSRPNPHLRNCRFVEIWRFFNAFHAYLCTNRSFYTVWLHIHFFPNRHCYGPPWNSEDFIQLPFCAPFHQIRFGNCAMIWYNGSNILPSLKRYANDCRRNAAALHVSKLQTLHTPAELPRWPQPPCRLRRQNNEKLQVYDLNADLQSAN